MQVIKLENSIRKELALGRVHDKHLLAKSAVIYNTVKQKLKEEKEEKEKEEEDKLEREQQEKKNRVRNIDNEEVTDTNKDVSELYKRGTKERKKKRIRRRNKKRGIKRGRKGRKGKKRKGRRKRKRKGRKRKKNRRVKKKNRKQLNRRKMKRKGRLNKKLGRKLNKRKRKRKRRMKKKMRRRRRRRKRRRKGRRRRRKGRRKGRRRNRRRRRKGRRRKRKRRRNKQRRRRRRRRKMRQRMRKFRYGRKFNLNLIQILKRLNQADYRSAAIRGTSIGLANRLVRRLMRAHRVARSWKSLRRRWPIVRSIKVFTVLLRRSETIIAAIRRRRVPSRRRPALVRHLKLALLHLDAIVVDLRRASDMISARTGQRVLAMLQLAVRTQRDAVWQAIHGTSRSRKKTKPRGIYFILYFSCH